jgi:hypothetical protein
MFRGPSLRVLMYLENQVFLPLDQLTRLVAQEYLIMREIPRSSKILNCDLGVLTTVL